MERSSRRPAKNPVVIVVDDDAAVRNALKFSLEIEGYAVRTYSDALDLLNGPQLPPDACLVMDYKLPGINGLEAITLLRERYAELPAILITTLPSTKVVQHANEANVPIVEKPLLEDALLKQIRAAATCR
jgi:FixJ family two-component response regulator